MSSILLHFTRDTLPDTFATSKNVISIRHVSPTLSSHVINCWYITCLFMSFHSFPTLISPTIQSFGAFILLSCVLGIPSICILFAQVRVGMRYWQKCCYQARGIKLKVGTHFFYFLFCAFWRIPIIKFYWMKLACCVALGITSFPQYLQ